MNLFSSDLEFLKSKDDQLIVLSDESENSLVIVSFKYQGKVFTSTSNGLKGKSFGFVNHSAFDIEDSNRHINVYGGENRFWLGPEGGKFSLFFSPNADQIFDNWHTPPVIDTESWNLLSFSKNEVIMTTSTQLKNSMDVEFDIELKRKIVLSSRSEITTLLSFPVSSSVNVVAYKTENSVINKNNFEWNEKTGTVCIWMLDMFNPSSKALTIIPYDNGDDFDFNKIAKTDYFGDIPKDRIKYGQGNIYLKTDGNYRSKLGLTALKTKSIAANYDPDSGRLTVVTFNTDKGATYLNQEWGMGKNTFNGDALNAFNDGPLDDGSIMGPFLELESSSPAAFLKPNESLTHYHNVYHFVGDENSLSKITEKLLNITIAELKTIFD